MTSRSIFVAMGTLMAIISSLAFAQPIEVNCDAGGTITQALASAQPGAILQVSGTCTESVTPPRAVPHASG